MQHSILIAGTDEVGRGCLAGPVYAAAVILNPESPIPGLADSKKLTAVQREKLVLLIEEKALAWAVAYATREEIDAINILQASLLAMQRAVLKLNPQPSLVLVDGKDILKLPYETRAIIGGDATEPAISAASILAKVARDKVMCELDLQYPNYGFADHKGYSTPQHLAALKKLGACHEHRRSYAPVRAVLGEVTV